MFTSDDTSPATKSDLKVLKKELAHEFLVVVEDLRSDFRAFGDMLLDHEGRLKIVERRLQLRNS